MRVLLVALALFAVADVARARVGTRRAPGPSRAIRHRGVFEERRRLTEESPEVSEQLAKLEIGVERPSFADNLKHFAGRTDPPENAEGEEPLKRRRLASDAPLTERLARVNPPMERPTLAENLRNFAGKPPPADDGAPKRKSKRKNRRGLRTRRLANKNSVAEQLKRMPLRVEQDSWADRVRNTLS